MQSAHYFLPAAIAEHRICVAHSYLYLPDERLRPLQPGTLTVKSSVISRNRKPEFIPLRRKQTGRLLVTQKPAVSSKALIQAFTEAQNGEGHGDYHESQQSNDLLPHACNIRSTQHDSPDKPIEMCQW